MSSRVRFLASLAMLGVAPALFSPFPFFPQFAAAGGKQESWIGEFVLFTKQPEDIKFSDRVGGKQVFFPFFGQMPIRVRDERRGLLRIYDGRRDGWVDRTEFILARDAPAFFNRLVQANPKDTWALYMRGSSWLVKGDLDSAIKDFDEFIRLDPTSAAAFNARAKAWSDKMNFDKARMDYNEAIRLDPKNSLQVFNRGNLWLASKQYDKALSDYDDAIRLDDQFAGAFNGRAWILATCPEAQYRDGKRAVASAKRACELNGWNQPNDLDTLAAAYAEAGEFEQAGKYQRQVIADPTLHPDARKRYEQRLKLYEAK